jgi:WD40 repeat protein
LASLTPFVLVEVCPNHYKQADLKKMAVADPSFGGECAIEIPDHDLLRLIGRGSYGEVWLARNIMGTYRAVKIIRRNAFDSDSPFEREFAGIKKFEPISRTHSGFVDILQIGRNQEERCLYYVMEAADDLDLGQAIDPDKYVPRTLGKALGRIKRFSVEQCVQMGLALCQALDHLHRNGLVHRDVKPSNIVFVNGVPKLADIGLVTESNNAHSFVGTEGFIPPEGPGSEQADIFSLGKALYEIAAGRDRLDFPALPAGLSEFPDGEQFLELNECLIRACRLNPQQRYASAREMYEDLALLASGKSLRRLRVLERRWASAKKTAAIIAAAIAIAAMIVWPLVLERRHADQLRERQIGVRSANGINKLDQGDLAGALGEFSEIYQLETANKHRYSANQVRVASILANTPKLTEMLFLEGRISSVEFSPRGTGLLTLEKLKQAQFHNFSAAATLVPPLQSNGATHGSLSPDGLFAAISDENGWASIWNLKSGEVERLDHPANVMCTRFSPSGKLIATACKDGVVRVWDAASKKLVFAKQGHKGTIRSVAFSPDERLLVSASNDGFARLWDVSTGEPVGSPMRHPSWVGDTAFSPDSKILLTAGYDGWARLWKVSTGEELPTLMKHDDLLTRVAYSPDGSTILTASNDSTVRLWNSRTTMPLPRNHVLRHSSGVLSACFNSEGQQIATGCADGTVRVWDLSATEFEPQLVEGTINDAGTRIATIGRGRIVVSNLSGPAQTNELGVQSDVRELALAENSRALAAVLSGPENSNTVHVWQSTETNAPVKIGLSNERVSGLKISPDGSHLSVRTAENNTTLTRVFDSSGVEWPLPDSVRHSAILAFHPNKRRLAIGTGDTVALFDGLSTDPFCPEIKVVGNIRHLAFSADGRRLLISQSDEGITPKSAVLVDADTGKPTGVEFWHRDGVIHGAFNSDGSRIITGGEDREALVWDALSPRELFAPLMHRQQVVAVAFSRDGRWIGSASSDGVARIWDGETGFPLTPPLRCEKSQSQIIFLPDQLTFATIQTSTRAWLWKLPQTDISPEDAVAMGHLLNADLRVVGQPDTKRISDIWSQLKGKYPNHFSSDKSQASQWHAKQYRLAEAAGDQYAMAFHMNCLRTLGAVDITNQSPGSTGPSIARNSR